MNSDQYEGKYKEIRGDVKKMWGKLTDDEIKQLDGDMDKFIGKVQAKYGESKSQIRNKMNDLIAKAKS